MSGMRAATHTEHSDHQHHIHTPAFQILLAQQAGHDAALGSALLTGVPLAFALSLDASAFDKQVPRSSAAATVRV